MKNLLFHLAAPAVFAVSMFMAGCATSHTSHPSTFRTTGYETLYLDSSGHVTSMKTKAAKPVEPGYWKGDGISGSPSVVINLTDQKAYFYKGGVLVGMSPVSTGREGYHTPAGHFSIIEKSPHHLSNLYGDYIDADGNILVRGIGIEEDPRPPGARFRGAPMPYFMRITGGVGMHEGYLPGVPDSHGCIRMPGEMAKIFYSHAPLGTPVTVRY